MSLSSNFLIGQNNPINNHRLKSIFSNDLFLISFFYILSYFFIAINIGAFWDDWVNYNHSNEILDQLADQVGAFPRFTLVITKFIFTLPKSLLIYHSLIFFTYFLISYFFYRLLDNFSYFFNKIDKIFISLIFTVLPINFARISFSTYAYGFCLLLFLIAWTTVLNCETREKKDALYFFKRFIALACFFLSFQMNSLLPLLGIVFVSLFIQKLLITHQLENLKRSESLLLKVRSFIPLIRKVSLQYLDIWLSPFLFWIIKKTFYSTTGVYALEQYNSFNLYSERILIDFIKSIRSFYIYGPLRLLETITASGKVFILFIILTIIILKIINYIEDAYRTNSKNDWENGPDKNCEVSTYGESLPSNFGNPRNAFYLLLFGLAIWLLSLAPYVLVGKPPDFADWESRHQVLLGLGASFIIYSLIILVNEFQLKSNNTQSKTFFELCFSRKRLLVVTPKNILISFILSSFVISNTYIYYQYAIDALKMASIIENLKGSKNIRKYNTFFIGDELESLNTLNRNIQFYEYTGMMRLALGDDSRFAILGSHLSWERIDYMKKYAIFPQYNFQNYSFQYLKMASIAIQGGAQQFKIPQFLSLYYQYFFKPNNFRNNIKNYVNLKFSPLFFRKTVVPRWTLDKVPSYKKSFCSDILKLIENNDAFFKSSMANNQLDWFYSYTCLTYDYYNELYTPLYFNN